MANIVNVSDYIIVRLNSGGHSDLNALKLQKLLFYTQAWNLAFDGVPLFEGKFQAWIHGPVNREIYNLYKDRKGMYSLIFENDVIDKNSISDLTEEEINHINSVLDAYAKYSPTQLEDMTHREEPWITARKGFAPYDRCENEISEELMKSYYKARL